MNRRSTLGLLAGGLVALGARSAAAQVSGNDAITVVNWPDKHVEVFVQTLAGQMLHATSSAPMFVGGEVVVVWSPLGMLETGNGADGAACGAAAAYWPGSAKSLTELYDPTPTGGAQHLWGYGGPYNAFQDFTDDTGTEVFSHLSTLFWPDDGRVEVFGLGIDHAIYFRNLTIATETWSAWTSVGGDMVTGAGMILWPDHHAEMFATDASGRAWHQYSNMDTPSTWFGWYPIGGSVASRPVPVVSEGNVELFARGADGQLQHSHWMQAGQIWSAFAVISPGTFLQGEPTVIVSLAGPEVFARDTSGQVVHLASIGSSYGTFSPHFDQVSASDPFAWVRADGSAEVFAIDPAGVLQHSFRPALGDWTAWVPIGGTALNPCVLGPPPLPADAGADAAGTGDAGPSATGGGGQGGAAGAGGQGGAVGTGGHGGAMGAGNTSGGCGCRTGAQEDASTAWLVAAVLGLLVTRRRYGKSAPAIA